MIRGLWDRETVALLLFISMVPMASVWLWFGGDEAAARLVLALLISGFWHLVFMFARAQLPSFAGVLTALAVAILSPEGLHIAQFVLGVSFGSVMAELVFGGWGRNVLNPATVSLAFLGFGFPAAPWPDLEPAVSWAAVSTLLIASVMGIMSARLIAGALAVLALGWAMGLAIVAIVPAACIVLALVVTDPVASASTRLGRWLNGALFGGLMILFATGWEQAAPVQMAVSAALLASIAAPLLDEFAIALWTTQRRWRHG